MRPSKQLWLPSVEPSSKGQHAKLRVKQKTSKTVFNKWWIMGVGIVINHLIGGYALLFLSSPLPRFYAAFALASFLQLWGITAGYHRLWSHGAFDASIPVRVALSIMGTAAWQGSIKWWVVRHRMHHRFTDTALDPYDSTKGFYYAHFGWLFEAPTYQEHFGMIDMSDLKQDWVVSWNKRMYPSGVIFFGVIFPVIMGLLMGNVLHGLIWIGVMSRIVSWNGIFLVNSWCHWEGSRLYNLDITAASSFVIALLTNGEANHNFHHEFPKDYRHGYRWYDYDPTKWLIWSLWKLGLVKDLYTTDAHLVQQAVLQQEEKQAERTLKKAKMDYAVHMSSAPSGQGTPNVQALPCYTKDVFIRKAAQAEGAMFIISDYVIDATAFTGKHPGGDRLLRAFHGKDATKPFFGGRNVHTPAACNLMSRYRVARIKKSEE